MDSFKILFKVIVIASTVFLINCTEDQTPTSAPHIDYIAPLVEWVDPESGSELSGTVELSFSVYDENSIDRIVIYRNGSQFGWGGHSCLPEDRNITATDDTLYTLEWNTIDIEDGVYILEARAWDEADNLGISPSLMVNVKNDTEPPEDHTPPVIVWHSPEPGSEISGLVDLRFEAMDNVAVDSVRIYLNGAIPQGFRFGGIWETSYSVGWNTTEYDDGIYSIEVQAEDSSGNIGGMAAVMFEVRNLIHSVIWVPDDYWTIQDAINESEDGDTVRVRPGVYREGLRLMGKNIWLESEEGPEVTLIDGDNQDECIEVWDGEQDVVIRGFKLVGDWKGITAGPPNRYFVYNCIFIGFPGHGAMIDDSNSEVYNCVFDLCVNGVSCAYTHGKLRNSIFVHCELAMWENAIFESHLDYGWSLFWDNQRDYNGQGFDYKESDVRGNPQFIPDTYRLSQDSPAIDAGDPSISDIDGSCSDIGVYGGPYAYPPP